VNIEGDIEEVLSAIRQIAGGGMGGGVAAVAPEESGIAAVPSAGDAITAAPADSLVEEPPHRPMAEWNISYVNTFWRNLSDTAKQAMTRVARSPNHVQKRAQLMHSLHLSQRALSGSLSSQGHSLNRLKRRRGDVDLPRPLTYDRAEDTYVLDAGFAAAMRQMGIN
jgi:hypothetical protein